MAVCLELLLLAPELAVLDTLGAALDSSVTALTAAHVELEAEDFAAAPNPPSPQSCLADAILTQAQALQHSLRRYRTLIAMQEVWARAAPSGESLPR